LIIPILSACRPELIGLLIVKKTVEKLLFGECLHENFSLAPLEWNLENFDVFVLFPCLGMFEGFCATGTALKFLEALRPSKIHFLARDPVV
jgi:hypothetical protein